jgi:mono/diheme cytochrome c family protein
MHVPTLDEDGLMLVNQLQWINVMPGEQRICTGCHGVREKDTDIKHMSIENDSVLFDPGTVELQRYMSGFFNSQKVTEHPSARTGILNFATLRDTTAAGAGAVTVQGIFNARCNECHGASAASSKGGGLVLEANTDTAFINHGTTNVYEYLTSGNHYVSGQNKTNYATDNGARQSPLAWVMFNRQLVKGNANTPAFKTPSYDHSALWQKDPASGKIQVFAKENADLLALIEWMDMGVQFMNSIPK